MGDQDPPSGLDPVTSLTLIDECLELQCQIEESLRQGLFHMMQARYQLSFSRPLDKTSYPVRMKARVRVAVDDAVVPGFTLMWDKDGAGADCASSGDDDNDSDAADDDECVSDLIRTVEAEGKGEPANQVTTEVGRRRRALIERAAAADPVTWFTGALAPPALKSAQEDFRQCLEAVVSLAGSRERLLSLLPDKK